ncbi:16157_t:CDS:1, partial [Funneliformis caledonium]
KNREEGRPLNKNSKFVGTMKNKRIAEKLRDLEAYYRKWNKTPRVKLENQFNKNKRKKVY